jgi:hypothetical protein
MKKNTKISSQIMFLYLLFVVLGFVNSLILAVINNVAPDLLALGNTYFTSGTAAFLVGFLLAFVVTFLEPFLLLIHIHVKHDLSWMVVFWIVNTELIWIFGRLASYTGIGLSAFWVAFEAGLVLNLLQWVVWYLLKRGFR